MLRISNPPKAENLLKGARSIGNYNLAAALADLIDNSITARCTWVKVKTKFSTIENYAMISIIDDGIGMSKEQLIDAMRPASQDPEDQREESDLGRFGWGMKSASFSQARSFTVITKKENVYHAANWNLDNCKNYEMDFWENDAAQGVLDDFELEIKTNSGTAIIWHNCDRLTDDGKITEDDFSSIIKEAQEQLQLIFHRYLNNKKLIFYFNTRELQGIDPFFSENFATQPCAEEVLKGENYNVEGDITIESFILPQTRHRTREEEDIINMGEGSVKNQGFYVYRKNRLIIYGTWFDIIKTNRYTDLLRVKIDIPTTMDGFWKISIDKKDAKLPLLLKKDLKRIITQSIEKAKSIYTFGPVVLKGKKDSADQHIWEQTIYHGKKSHKINLKHLSIQAFMDNLSAENLKIFKSILGIIELNPPRIKEDDVISIMPDEQRNYIEILLSDILIFLEGKERNEIEELVYKQDIFVKNKKIVKDFLDEHFV